MAHFEPPCSDVRPSLPPLHSLGLPYPLVRAERTEDYDSHDPYDRLSPETLQPHPRPCPRGRQSSISSTTSSCTARSRSGSPSNPFAPPPEGVTLLLTTMDKADALIVIPQVPPVPQLPSPPPSPSHKSRPAHRVRPLLITGPMVDHFRQNHVRISRIARMHPYRMVPKAARRASTSLHESLYEPRRA